MNESIKIKSYAEQEAEINYRVEERAAILEFDAGFSRSEAEKNATDEVYKEYSTSEGIASLTKNQFQEIVSYFIGLKKQKDYLRTSHLDTLEPK